MAAALRRVAFMPAARSGAQLRMRWTHSHVRTMAVLRVRSAGNLIHGLIFRRFRGKVRYRAARPRRAEEARPPPARARIILYSKYVYDTLARAAPAP